ncbi:MAG: nuclear transport factor 2 family protein [Actinomycetota bacterium]
MQDKHPNAQLIERFYDAFGRHDGEAMVACYHPDVEFSDDVFGPLDAEHARGMWRMFCATGTDLRVESTNVTADDRNGSARWDAWYTFAATGKKVHNVIDARFEFSDGLIRRHADSFSFPRWAGQALGLTGKLFGRLPFLRKAVRARAHKTLNAYLKSSA